MKTNLTTKTTGATTKTTSKIGGFFKSRKFKKILTTCAAMAVMTTLFAVTASATTPVAPAGGGNAEATYQTVIEFFITWLTRIGMLVGLVGAIMFALAIKSNDAEQKQAGLLTMVAGFVVAAVCGAAAMFNLFA